MYWLSGRMLESVNKNAAEMVEEVRRQAPDILLHSARPEYNRCIDICTKHALKEMVVPVAVSLLSPIIIGLVFGAQAVAGLLVGTILVAMVMATSTANSGGAWDNAKKWIKANQERLTQEHGSERYELMHQATVIGDTVGDPFKDVVGPNQDIMIKMMATISMIMRPVFTTLNFAARIF